jgi:hypothetical protein
LVASVDDTVYRDGPNRPGIVGGCWFKSGGHFGVVHCGAEVFFGFGRRDVADGFEKALQLNSQPIANEEDYSPDSALVVNLRNAAPQGKERLDAPNLPSEKRNTSLKTIPP